MLFGRRKSIGKPEAIQDLAEVKPRTNRLSKPYTNRPFINSTILSSQDLRGLLNSPQASSNASIEGPGVAASGPVPAPAPAPMSLEEKREIKTQLFDQDICRDPAKSPTKPPNERPRGGVAMMISKFEANSDSQRPFQSSPKPKRPLSRIFTLNKASTPTTNKPESPSSQQSEDRVMAPASASDPTVVSTPIPPSRRSSFKPGTATRKSVIVETVPEDPDANKPEGIDQLATIPGKTPNSLDYTHLGGLQLGSLHIVNGRASPAASDASRLPLARRDVSSDYGSESGQRDHTLPGFRHPLARSREVSGLSSGSINSDVFANPATLPSIAAAVATTPAVSRKGASAVAAEYISELAPSPFNGERVSSLTRVSEVEIEAETASIHSIPEERKENYVQPSHSPSYAILSQPSDCQVDAKSETGSILQTTTKQTEIEDQLLDDDDNSTRVGTITPEPGQTPRQSLDSIQSWHSPMKSDYGVHEALDSAVEFQYYSSTAPSPVEEGIMDSPVLGRFSDMRQVVLPHQHESGKSDSGYSSANSVSSLPREQVLAPTTRTRAPALASESDPMLHLTATETEPAQPSSSSPPFRPTLESRKTAPADLSSFREVQALSQLAHSSTGLPKMVVESTKPKPKKLQKRILAKKEALVVQKVASLDCLSVPFVSPEMSAKLEARVRGLPELEKTVESLRDDPHRIGHSDVDLSNVNLRFPSPTPEPEPPRRWSGRIISGTLHGAWFGKQKASEAKLQPDVSEHDPRAIISDFGTVASSIGGSPYDLARGQGQESDMFRGRLNPANISNRMPRPKSMFDDQTAGELARLRSRTMKEAATNSQRGSSADGRRYTARQHPIPSSMPYLPGQIHPGGRNSQQWSNQDDHPGNEWDWKRAEHEDVGRQWSQDRARGPRPLAPSPQPMSNWPRRDEVGAAGRFNESQNFGGYSWNEPVDGPPPPPAPSHSPRPVDIWPEDLRGGSADAVQRDSQDLWGQQAALWRARRETAGETLKRQSWQEGGDVKPRKD
ncbi:hypothetical protein DV735_g862, partial [Chaetothyriales sp. CBS 134920]